MAAEKPVDHAYYNSSQQCLMAVVGRLASHMLQPQTIADIAAALDPDYKPDQVRRALWNLEQQGWAQETGSGYALSPTLTRISDQLRQALITISRQYLEG
jgi:DNA-binding IclR family transcriptional regulator